MKKFLNFIFYCLVLLSFVIIISLIVHLRMEKTDTIWIFYTVSQDILLYLPVCAALGVLWGRIIRSKSEMTGGGAGAAFFGILYIIIMMAGAVAFQEILVPKLYDLASYQVAIKSKGLTEEVRIGDTTGPKFSLSEFKNTPYMAAKRNVAFYMGNSLVYFDSMYNGNGAYYVTGFRMIVYKDNKKNIDYIMTADYGKICDMNLYVVSPTYLNTSGSDIDRKLPITLTYNPAAIFNLTADIHVKTASLIDVYMFNDYIYGSNINFYRLGNIVFNKISYYIILIVLLILAAGFGAGFKNQRLIGKDFFPAAAFYAVTFALTILCYDIMLSIANMIYGIIV